MTRSINRKNPGWNPMGPPGSDFTPTLGGGMNLPQGPGGPQGPQPPGPNPPFPQPPGPNPPFPQPPGPNPPGPPTPPPIPEPPRPGPPGDPFPPRPVPPRPVPPTPVPPTPTPTPPTTPTMPTGGGFQPSPVTGGGFGGDMGGGPSSPVTPNINDQFRPNDNFTGGFGTGGGGGYRPPSRGTGPITNKNTNTWNIGGDTSVTKGDVNAQKTPKKTFKQPKVAMGQKMIGDPKMAMQQLSAMNQTPFMRRA